MSEQSSLPAHPPGPGRWRLLVLFVGALALHLAGTWSLPLIDRDEPRFAEASREMVQRGDWILPTLNNHPRYDKPPLIYWLQGLAYRTFGENEFSARLPSAVAAALTALVIASWGSRIRGARAGLWAAVIFSTALQTLVHARLAVADMLMILFFTSSAWSGWELLDSRTEGKSSWGWWLVFNISLGLAFLAKGPVGLIPLLLPILTPCLRREPVPWSRLNIVPGVLLILILVGAWGVPALLATNGDFWRVGMGKHVIERSVGVLDGHGASHLAVYLATLPLYFVTVFASFFPWSIWLIFLGRFLWSGRTTLSRHQTYLLIGIALVFGIFSLVRTKLPHYTLPALPLLALLLSLAWENQRSDWRIPRRWVVVVAVLMLALAFFAFPRLAPLSPSRAVFHATSAWLRPEMEFASADFEEPSLYWYFRGRLRGFHQFLALENLPAFMAKTGPRLCILPTDRLASIFPQRPPDWKMVQTHGFNTANGKWVDLTALVKTADDQANSSVTLPR